MPSPLRSFPLPLVILFLPAGAIPACTPPVDKATAADPSMAAPTTQPQETPTPGPSGGGFAVQASDSAPVTTHAPSSMPATGAADCTDAGHELEDYPYIVIGGTQSIKEQLQLFPGDKVKIVGTDKDPLRVRFGDFWQQYVDGKEYTVSGVGPISPAFDFGNYGSSKINFKLLVKYRCYRKEKRYIGADNGPVPAP